MSINGGGRSTGITDGNLPTNIEKQKKQNNGRISQSKPQGNYIPSLNNVETNKSKISSSLRNRKVTTSSVQRHTPDPKRFQMLMEQYQALSAKQTLIKESTSIQKTFGEDKSLRPNSPVQKVDFVATRNGSILSKFQILPHIGDTNTNKEMEKINERFKQTLKDIEATKGNNSKALSAELLEKKRQLSKNLQIIKTSVRETEFPPALPSTIILPIRLEKQPDKPNIDEFFEFEVCIDDISEPDYIQHQKDSQLSKKPTLESSTLSTPTITPQSPTAEGSRPYFVSSSNNVFPVQTSQRASKNETLLEKSPLLPAYKQPPVTKVIINDQKPTPIPTDYSWDTLKNHYLPVMDPFNIDTQVFKNILDAESLDIESAKSIRSDNSIFSKLTAIQKVDIDKLANKKSNYLPAESRYTLKNCATVLFEHAKQFSKWKGSSQFNDKLFLSHINDAKQEPAEWLKSAKKREKFYNQRVLFNNSSNEKATNIEKEKALTMEVQNMRSKEENLKEEISTEEDKKVRAPLLEAVKILQENIKTTEIKLKNIQFTNNTVDPDPLFNNSNVALNKGDDRVQHQSNLQFIHQRYLQIENSYNTALDVLGSLDNREHDMAERPVARDLVDTHLIIRQMACEISREYDATLYSNLGQDAADEFKKEIPLNHKALEKKIRDRLDNNKHCLPQSVKDNFNNAEIRQYINELVSVHAELADHPLNFFLEVAKEGDQINIEDYTLDSKQKKQHQKYKVGFTSLPNLRYNPGKDSNKPSLSLVKGIIEVIKTPQTQINSNAYKTENTKETSTETISPPTPSHFQKTKLPKTASNQTTKTYTDTNNNKIDPEFNKVKDLLDRLNSMSSNDKSIQTALKKRYDRLKNKKLNMTKASEKQDSSTIESELDQLKNDIQDQTSKIAAYKLEHNNPNIANLEDPIRADKISSNWYLLYDDDWTDALDECLSDGHHNHQEKEIIKNMHQFMQNTYNHWMRQRHNFEAQKAEQHTSPEGANTTPIEVSKAEFLKHFFNNGVLDTKFSNNKLAGLPNSEKVTNFMNKTNTLIAQMICHTPPLVLESTSPGDLPNTNLYIGYTQSGTHVEYPVFPVLLLEKNGPVLQKGVYQLYNKNADPQLKKIEDLLERISSITSKDDAIYKESKKRYVQLKSKTHITTKKQDSTAINKEIAAFSQELNTKLTDIMGRKLLDGNPNITDLSDANRPTKIAEKWVELYDNTWTDAMEDCEAQGSKLDNASKEENEVKAVKNLHDFIENTYKHMVEHREKFEAQRAEQYTPPKGTNTTQPDVTRDELTEYFFKDGVLKDGFSNNKHANLPTSKNITIFMNQANTLIARMLCQVPACVLESTTPGLPLNTSIERHYQKSGSHVKYSVWPSLFLYKDGPILIKGVSEGYTP